MAITISVPRKGAVDFNFDHQPASKVTVGEVKAAVNQKYPKAGLPLTWLYIY